MTTFVFFPCTIEVKYSYQKSFFYKTITLKNILTEHTQNKFAIAPHFDIIVQYNAKKGTIEFQIENIYTITLHNFNINICYNFNVYNEIHCNGFQSWSATNNYPHNARFKPLNPILKSYMQTFGDYFLHTYTGKKGLLHSWNYTYIIEPNARSPIHFIGSLNEQLGYTCFQYNCPANTLTIEKKVEGWELPAQSTTPIVSLFFTTQNNEYEAFNHYFDALNMPNLPASNPIAGFTTWYNYYTNISQKNVLENLYAFQKHQVPLHFFQIDDGWQTNIGDWLYTNTQKFENGMQWLAQQIKTQGYKAGLWLAPFVCTSSSSIYKNKSQWLLRQKNGKPIHAGYNVLWKSYIYVLDFYNPEVQNYIKLVLNTILYEWGFDMVKLDFLYAVALQAPPQKTTAMVMNEALIFLQNIVNQKTMLGCGVPIAAAWNKMQYCRIGADIHLQWDENLLKYVGNRERPSTINALKNTIYRHPYNARTFFNDPDVSILRNTNIKLSFDQKFTLFLINQILGNMQFISDNINEYDSYTLKLYLYQFPLKYKKIINIQQKKHCYKIFFNIDTAQYVAFCNLSAQKYPICLDIPYVSYFESKQQRFFQPNTDYFLKPFESVCFLITDNAQHNLNTSPICCGSTLHLFPGSEITHCKLKNDILHIELSEQCQQIGTQYWKINSNSVQNYKALINNKKSVNMLYNNELKCYELKV